jgi:hypothetical protein
MQWLQLHACSGDSVTKSTKSSMVTRIMLEVGAAVVSALQLRVCVSALESSAATQRMLQSELSLL